MSDDKSLWVRIFGDASGVQTAMQQASSSVRQGVSQIKEHTDGLTSVFSRLNVVMAGVGAVLGGGAVFREAVAETVKLTKEAQMLGRQFGVTTSQASTLAIALGDVHVTTQQANAANSKITVALRSNEEAFTALGVATRDQSGHYRSALDVMMDTNAALANIREGVDRNIEGQKIYGRSWDEVSGTLRLTRDTMAAAQEKADELGLTIGERSVASTNAYREAMNDVGDVITATKKAIGDALLPVLTRMGNWFASIGPQAVNVIKNAMLGLRIVVEGLAASFTVTWNVIAGVVEQITTAVASVATALGKAMQGDFSGAVDALRIGGEQMVEIAKQKAGNIAQAFKDAQASVADAMAGAWTKDKPITSQASSGAERSSGPAPADNKSQKKDGHEYDAELAELNARLEAYRNNMDARLELARQAAERAKEIYGADSREYARAQKVIVDTEREKAEQVKQISATLAATKVAQQLAEIDAQQQNARLATDLGQQTKDKLLQQEMAFESSRLAIRKQAILEAIVAEEQDPDRSPVKLATLHAQIEELELAHQMRLKGIKNDAALESFNFQLQLQGNLESRFNTLLMQYKAGATTMAQAFRALTQSVTQALLQTLAQYLARRAAVYTAELLMGKRTLIIGAAQAAVNAAKSAAQIPFVGWALALGAAAAVYAGLKSMSSAAGGYDIPAGVNPMTQLHEKEMVLPAKHADVIRSLADGGGAGGRGDTHNWNLHMIDGSSGRQFIENHGGDIAKEMVKQYRNGFMVPA